MAGKSINRSVTIRINGKEVKNSLNSVRNEMYKLQREVYKTTRGTEEYTKKSRELRKVKKYYKDLRQEITGIPTLFQRMTKNAAGLTALIGVGFGAQRIWSGMKEAVRNAASLSDQMAAVQKTTDMSKKEVKELVAQLDELDTRTSREDLLGIATEGGRIGIANEDMADFVKVMDMANVALGDTFGSAEEVASTLGKLRFLFKETKELGVGEAYNAIGSALNELGKTGVATEGNVAEFATRVGAMPEVLKPTSAEALALGAAFEESGIMAQVSSRSFGIFMQQAAKETAGFAKVMGITTKEAEDLINTNPTEFFLQFSQKLAEGAKNGTDMSNTLNDLGLTATGVTKIVGAAGSNFDKFRKNIETANTAMVEGTSLAEEFGVVNETLGAILDKIKKEFHEFVTTSGLIDFLESVLGWFAKLIGATEDTDGKMAQWRSTLLFLAKTLAVLTAATLSYRAAMMLANKQIGISTARTKIDIATKAIATLATKSYRGATLLLAAAKLAVTGNIKKATVAMRAFNIVTRMNPIGLLVGAIAAAATAFLLFRKRAKETVDLQKQIEQLRDRVNKKAESYAEDEIARVKSLLTIAKDEKISRENRIKAIKELNEIAPEYLENLNIENINTTSVTSSINKYIKALEKKARTQAATEELEELSKRELELEKDKLKAKESQEKKEEEISNKKGQAYASEYELMERVGKQSDALFEARENKIKKEKALLKSIINEGGFLVDDDDEGGGGGSGLDETEEERRQKLLDKLLAQHKKNDKALLSAKRKAQDEALELMEDGLDKERQKLIYASERKIEDLQAEIDRRKTLQKQLLEQADTEESRGNTTGAKALRKLAEEQVAIIEQQEATKVSIKEAHQIKLQQLDFKYRKKEWDDTKKQTERLLRNLKTRHDKELHAELTLEEAKKTLKNQYGFSDTELEAVNNLEEAKKKLVLQHQQETLDVQKQQLEAHIKTLEELVASEESLQAQGLLGLLTPEQLELVNEQLEIARAKLAEISKGGTDEEDTGAGDFNTTNKSAIDILGFSAEQWEETFNNLDTAKGKVQAIGMVLSSLANVWGTITKVQNRAIQEDLSNYERATNRKKDALNRQLEAGYISQSEYNAKVERLEADLAKKKAEADYKMALNEWRLTLVNAVAQTALSVAQALPNIPLAAIVGALGAVQIGIVASNKPKKPKYAVGGPTAGLGYRDETGHEVAGTVHANEYVIPEWLRRDPQVAQMEEFIENRRRGRTPVDNADGMEASYADGGKVKPPERENNQSDGNPTTMLLNAINRLNGNLEYLQQNPIEAKLSRNLEVAKKLKEDMGEYDYLRNKAKV